MIIRRLAEGIRNQDWFVVMVEIMIVVVGIFIGLQVDDWNDKRKDQLLEHDYIERLIVEVEQLQVGNTSRTEDLININDRLKAAYQTLIDGVLDEGSLEEFNINLGAFNAVRSAKTEINVLNELITTGKLYVIDSTEILNAINNFSKSAAIQRQSAELHFGLFLRLRERFHGAIRLEPANTKDFASNAAAKHRMSVDELSNNKELMDILSMLVELQLAELVGNKGFIDGTDELLASLKVYRDDLSSDH